MLKLFIVLKIFKCLSWLFGPVQGFENKGYFQNLWHHSLESQSKFMTSQVITTQILPKSGNKILSVKRK